jgi:hypothetical protein
MEASRENEEQQVALYQALRREVDERKRERGKDEPVELACECADPSCTEPLALTAAEVEYIRRVPNRLVVKIGHVDETSERVIMEEPGRFQVLEKFGPGEDVVAHLHSHRPPGWADPRD